MIFIARVGLITAFLSLVSMVIGHFGAQELSAVSSQISSYAAKAPNDYLITTSMLLASLTLLVISYLNSKYHLFGGSHVAHLIPAISGAASFGLLMLSYFEETAPNLDVLKKSGFMAIRVQSFHDAGLLMFYYSSLALAIILGTLSIIYCQNRIHKVLGGIMLSMSPTSLLLMTTKWPKALGLDGVTVGLNQRAALFCLWVAFTIILAMVSINAFKPTSDNGAI